MDYINDYTILKQTLSTTERFFKTNNISYRISKIDDCSLSLKKDLRFNRIDLELKSLKNFKDIIDYNTTNTAVLDYIENNKDIITVISARGPITPEKSWLINSLKKLNN